MSLSSIESSEGGQLKYYESTAILKVLITWWMCSFDQLEVGSALHTQQCEIRLLYPNVQYNSSIFRPSFTIGQETSPLV